MDIDILYEDNHLLVVSKPVNIPVQQDRSNDLDLLTILKQDIKERYNKPGNVYLGLIHRLDRPVGGAIVFAKTSKAASRLSNELRKRQFKRSYLAVVRGQVRKKHAILKHYLVKNNRKNIVYVTNEEDERAKQAILNYKRIASNEDLSLLSVELETGRPHQIRVQLSHIGHPIYGDQKYGSQINKRGEQIALWSYRVQFKHPTKKEVINIISPPPKLYPWNRWGHFY